MVQSEYFGRTFWFGKDNQLKSAPTFVDNSVDISMTDYVSDWTDWEGVSYYELFDIVAELVTQKEARLAWLNNN